jgi:hypothetical protein
MFKMRFDLPNLKITGLSGAFLSWDKGYLNQSDKDNLIQYNQAAGSNVLTSLSNLSPNFILAISVS